MHACLAASNLNTLIPFLLLLRLYLHLNSSDHFPVPFYYSLRGECITMWCIYPWLYPRWVHVYLFLLCTFAWPILVHVSALVRSSTLSMLMLRSCWARHLRRVALLSCGRWDACLLSHLLGAFNLVFCYHRISSINTTRSKLLHMVNSPIYYYYR